MNDRCLLSFGGFCAFEGAALVALGDAAWSFHSLGSTGVKKVGHKGAFPKFELFDLSAIQRQEVPTNFFMADCSYYFKNNSGIGDIFLQLQLLSPRYEFLCESRVSCAPPLIGGLCFLLANQELRNLTDKPPQGKDCRASVRNWLYVFPKGDRQLE